MPLACARDISCRVNTAEILNARAESYDLISHSVSITVFSRIYLFDFKRTASDSFVLFICDYSCATIHNQLR